MKETDGRRRKTEDGGWRMEDGGRIDRADARVEEKWVIPTCGLMR